METLVDCPLCGQAFRSVAHHLFPGHGVTAAQFRESGFDGVLISEASSQAYANAVRLLLANDPERKRRLLEAGRSPEARAKQGATMSRLYREGKVAPIKTYGGKPKIDRSRCLYCNGAMPPEYATSHRNRRTCSDECAHDLAQLNNQRTRQQRTHCKNGHELTPENTVWKPTRHGTKTRRCRVCVNAAKRRHYYSKT